MGEHDRGCKEILYTRDLDVQVADAPHTIQVVVAASFTFSAN
jgi:hypothetical protein